MCGTRGPSLASAAPPTDRPAIATNKVVISLACDRSTREEGARRSEFRHTNRRHQQIWKIPDPAVSDIRIAKQQAEAPAKHDSIARMNHLSKAAQLPLSAAILDQTEDPTVTETDAR